MKTIGNHQCPIKTTFHYTVSTQHVCPFSQRHDQHRCSQLGGGRHIHHPPALAGSTTITFFFFFFLIQDQNGGHHTITTADWTATAVFLADVEHSHKLTPKVSPGGWRANPQSPPACSGPAPGSPAVAPSGMEACKRGLG